MLRHINFELDLNTPRIESTWFSMYWKTLLVNINHFYYISLKDLGLDHLKDLQCHIEEVKSPLYMNIPCPSTFIPNCLNVLSTYYYLVTTLMKYLIDQFLVSAKVLFSIIIYMNGNFYSPSANEYGGWMHILNLVVVKSMPCYRLKWTCFKCSMNVSTTFFHFGEINHYETTFVEWKKV